MPVTPLRDSDPVRVGPHRLLGRLGQGGMGTVFLGVSPDDRAVAVKVLRDGLADPDARRRFRHELDALRRVRGPHLVEVLDADVDADTPYLVTRFVPGKRLDDLVHRAGPLGVDDLRLLARGLADALTVLHSGGVVHRDLTPGNVLMLDGQPHVIDLGLATAADVTALTRSGLVIGTPGYLAPEQVTGSVVTPAVDVHAWGATVAFAATGRPPYGTGRPEAVLYNLVHGRPDLDGVPAELADLVADAMHADPLLRPAAPALLEALGGASQAETMVVHLPHDVDATSVLEPGQLRPRELALVTPVPTRYDGGAIRALAEPPVHDGQTRFAASDGQTRLDAPVAPSLYDGDEQPTRVSARTPPPRHVVPWTEDPPADDRTRDDQPWDQERDEQGWGDGAYDDDDGALAPLPPRTHPARALQVGATSVAALAVVGAATLVAPVLGAIGALLLLVGLRAVGRSSERLRDRRDRRGERRRDPVVATLGAPWHLLLAAVDTLTALPLMALVAAPLAGLVYVADPVLSGLERDELSVATATVAALVVGLSRRVHRRSRLLLRRTMLTLTPGASSAVALVLGLGLIAALLLATAEGRAPDWFPLTLNR